MTNARVEEEWPIKPLQSLEGMKDFNITKYLNENIYLLAGDVINATIEIENPEHIVFIKDWFGKNARLYKKEGKILADIKSNESALFYWYMQYSETMRIVSPQSLIERVKKEAERIVKKYE